MFKHLIYEEDNDENRRRHLMADCRSERLCLLLRLDELVLLHRQQVFTNGFAYVTEVKSCGWPACVL